MQQREKAPRIRPAPCISIVETPSLWGAHSARVQGGFVVVFVKPDTDFTPFPNGAMTRYWT